MSCQIVIQILLIANIPPCCWFFPGVERCEANESQLVSSSMQASFQRSNSHDKVRKIVAEEGRTARNLIAWSVPLENKEEEGSPLHTNQTARFFWIVCLFPHPATLCLSSCN